MSDQEEVISTVQHIFDLWGPEAGMCFILGSIKVLCDEMMFGEDRKKDLMKVQEYVTLGLEQIERSEEKPSPGFGFSMDGAPDGT